MSDGPATAPRPSAAAGVDPDGLAPAGAELDFAVFRVGQAWLAVPAMRALRFVELPQLEPVPLAPPALLGVGNAGGRLLSALDLSLLLGLEREAHGGSRCLVVSVGEDAVALSLDAVDSVARVPESAVRAAGEDGRGYSAGTFTLQSRHVTVIDLDRLVDAVEASIPGT